MDLFYIILIGIEVDYKWSYNTFIINITDTETSTTTLSSTTITIVPENTTVLTTKKGNQAFS